MAKLQLKAEGGEPTVIELRRGAGDHFIAEVNGARVEGEIQESPGGGYLLRLGHRVVPCSAVRKDSKIDVWMDGETYRFDVIGAKGRSGAAALGQLAEEILAPMPGTVLRIEVRAGDAFAAHQPLIIMESMKMEMTLSSPHGGRVGQIECRVGELVPMGKVLVKLEPLKSDAEPASSSKRG